MDREADHGFAARGVAFKALRDVDDRLDPSGGEERLGFRSVSEGRDVEIAAPDEFLGERPREGRRFAFDDGRGDPGEVHRETPAEKKYQNDGENGAEEEGRRIADHLSEFLHEKRHEPHRGKALRLRHGCLSASSRFLRARVTMEMKASSMLDAPVSFRTSDGVPSASTRPAS